MQIVITKKDDAFALEIKSGHFSGILEPIPEENMEDLKNSLESLLNGESGSTKTWSWNPRSGRHEYL